MSIALNKLHTLALTLLEILVSVSRNRWVNGDFKTQNECPPGRKNAQFSVCLQFSTSSVGTDNFQYKDLKKNNSNDLI